MPPESASEGSEEALGVSVLERGPEEVRDPRDLRTSALGDLPIPETGAEILETAAEIEELSELAQTLQIEAEKYRQWQLTRRALTQYAIPFRIDGELHMLEGRVTTQPGALLRAAGKDPRYCYVRIEGGESYQDRPHEMIVLLMGTRFKTVDAREETDESETRSEEGRGENKVKPRGRSSKRKRRR